MSFSFHVPHSAFRISSFRIPHSAFRISLAPFLLCLLLAACARPRQPQLHNIPLAELSHPLTLDQCLWIALTSDVHTRQWRARLDTARAELTGARVLPNPTFEASWEDLGIKDIEKTALANSTYGLSYPIFFWWTRPKEIEVARGKLTVEQRGVAADQLKLAIEVGSAYYTILAGERKERAIESLLAEARSAQRLAEESFKVGTVSGHDVDLARTEVIQAEAELFDARRETRAQRLAFAFALGADRPVAIKVAETSPTLPAELAGPVTTATLEATVPEALIQRVLKADPAYAKAVAGRKAAEAAVSLEYRKIVPLSEAHGGAARKDDPEGMGYNLGFEIPIPLFNWNQGGVRKARAELLAAQAEVENVEGETINALSEAWEGYQTARERATAYADRITRSRARLARDAQDLFASGQLNYTDLIQARREWRQAELAGVDAWRERMISAWKIAARFMPAPPPKADGQKRESMK